MKQNKGITLIALVITIVVLLILAGVTIAMLTGENGVLNKTKETKIANELTEIKDKIILAWNELEMEYKLRKNEDLLILKEDIYTIENLRKILGIKNVENFIYNEKEKSYIIYVQNNKTYEVFINSNGEILINEKSIESESQKRIKQAYIECKNEYESKKDENPIKKDYFNQEKMSSYLSQGRITDFVYNQNEGSELIYYDENNKVYYMEILEQEGVIKIIEQEENLSDAQKKDWNNCISCSEENPHIITNKYDFDSIRTHINKDENENIFIGGFYKLNNDIVFKEEDFKETGDFYNRGIGFLAIGKEGNNNGWDDKFTPCKIMIDGNNYFIKNIKMSYKEGMQFITGIFANFSEGIVKNIKLWNCSNYAPTYGGLIARTIGKNATLENIEIYNSEAKIWKSVGAMGNSGFICGVLAGKLKNIKVESCDISLSTWYSGTIAGTIQSEAVVDGIDINNTNIYTYVESGLLAYSIEKNVKLSNIKIDNTTYKYGHPDTNRSGILAQIAPKEENNMILLENSNIKIKYDGTVRSLITLGYSNIKNSKITIIHNQEKANMAIIPGVNSQIENTNIMYGYINDESVEIIKNN